MAIQNDKGESFGKVGKTIKRRWKHLTVVQEAPGKGGVKQTEETKRSASAFGQVSSWGSMIRNSFKYLIMGYYDTVMTSRLTGCLNLYLKGCYNREDKTWNFEQNTLKALEGFEFNIDSPVKRNFFIIPQYSLNDNKLFISFPEFIAGRDFLFPKDCSGAEITIMVREFNLEQAFYSIADQTESIVIEKNEDHNVAASDFTFDVSEGCLCVASIGIKYFDRSTKWDLLKNTKEFSPAAIICALFNGGSFNEANNDVWRKRYKTTVNHPAMGPTEIR